MGGRVLSVASEAVPLIKTGGLADVVGALPGALAQLGWQTRVLLPAYPGVLAKLGAAREVWAAPELFGGPGRVMLGSTAEFEVLALDAPHLFARAGGPYSDTAGDFGDNPERFAALCWVGAELARSGDGEGWRPDIVHAHDWQGGLAPAYLRYRKIDVPSLITVHNIAFQGVTGADRLASLQLPPEAFGPDGVEYWGNISALKAGLMCADSITTVSPRYADELMRPEFGLGLEGMIAARAGVVHGILNGIDTTLWNPAADAAIVPVFGARVGRQGRKPRAAVGRVRAGGGCGALGDCCQPPDRSEGHRPFARSAWRVFGGRRRALRAWHWRRLGRRSNARPYGAVSGAGRREAWL